MFRPNRVLFCHQLSATTAIMKDHNSANKFVTKMESGALDGKVSGELGRLSYDELAEVERILIDTMKSRTSSKDLRTVNHDSSAEVCGESAALGKAKAVGVGERK